MYFTTTRLHQEMAGGRFADVIIAEAHDPLSEHPFKGNVDLEKLETLIRRVGEKNIPYVSLAGRDMEAMALGIAESVAFVHAGRENIRGLRMTYEPRYLRFFQARFERL